MNNVFQSRRTFLQSLSGISASAYFFGSCSDDSGTSPTPSLYAPRGGRGNLFLDEFNRPILVCVEGQDFEAMIQEGLSRLGGLQTLVDNNQTVLIKPNCNYSDIYPGISSVDCITSLIGAVLDVLTGTVQVGDQGYQSSSIVYPYLDLKNHVTNAGGTLLGFTLDQVYRVRGDNWDQDIPDCEVYRQVYDSPIILNCCVLKRHHSAVMTGSLKNNVGDIAGPNANKFRNYLHTLDGDAFQQCVAEIAALIRPELNVVDARQVLTKDGPFAHSGVPVWANKLILCGDMVATDAYGAQLLAFHDETFSADMIQPTLERAEQLGLGTSDLSQVTVIEVSL